jgi:uncharacterized damage-inducible protein DinB
MLKQVLIQYTLYNLWANELLLSLIRLHVDDKMLDQKIASSFPSLRKTVYHIWDAEFIWLRRLKNESPNEWPSKTFNGNFKEAVEGMLSTDHEFIEYVEGLSDEMILELFTYKSLEGETFTNPRWESVHHCMNHSTYHRGQVVTMLRQLGIAEIPSTDFIVYCRKVGVAG